MSKIERAQRLKVRGRKGGPSPRCAKCKKRRALVGAICHEDGRVEPERIYCMDCTRDMLIEGAAIGARERAAKQALVSRVTKTDRPPKSLVAKDDGSKGGTLDWIKSMILEGKTKKQIRKAFRKLYHSRGKTDEKWIRVRVRKYLNSPTIREFRKLHPIKKGTKA